MGIFVDVDKYYVCSTLNNIKNVVHKSINDLKNLKAKFSIYF